MCGKISGVPWSAQGRRASKGILVGLSMLTAVWLTGYTALTLLATVPSCPEVQPPNTPACNLAEYVDTQIMGINHMYPYPTCHKAQPPCLAFDPEGLFATVGGATVSTLLGLLAGYAYPHCHFFCGYLLHTLPCPTCCPKVISHPVPSGPQQACTQQLGKDEDVSAPFCRAFHVVSLNMWNISRFRLLHQAHDCTIPVPELCITTLD